MATCRYQGCWESGPVNQHGVCARCERVSGQIEECLERGELPHILVREIRVPRTTRMERDSGGMPCAGSGGEIRGPHWAYPDYPKPGRPDVRGWNLHFHYLCHEIWEELAVVAAD